MNFYKEKLQIIRTETYINDEKFKKPEDVVKFINSIEHYDLSANENVICIALNSKNNILAYSEISIGGTNLCNMNISSIFRFLLTTNANKFILVHNHPSGDSKPSQIDMDTTGRIEDASNIIGINFLDHIIIGNNEYTSIFSEIFSERRR